MELFSHGGPSSQITLPCFKLTKKKSKQKNIIFSYLAGNSCVKLHLMHLSHLLVELDQKLLSDMLLPVPTSVFHNSCPWGNVLGQNFG